MHSEAGRAQDVVDMMESCSESLRSAGRQPGKARSTLRGFRLRVLEPPGVLPLPGQEEESGWGSW